MEFTFNYLEYQYRVKELGRGAEVRIVHTEMELEYNEILGPAEASLLMKLLASSGKEIAAPANVADNLRHAMRDFQRRLIETVRNKGYRLSVKVARVRDHAVGRAGIELDPVRVRLPVSFLNGREGASPLVLDEVNVLGRDAKFFVRGYLEEEDLDPQSVAFLGGGESSEILDWLDVSLSEVVETASPCRDGHVLRRANNEPLAFIGRSGKRIRLAWEAVSRHASTRSVDPKVDPGAWSFRNDEHRWEFDGARIRRWSLGDAESEPVLAELNVFESRLLLHFLRHPGMHVSAADLSSLLWPGEKFGKRTVNTLRKHLAALAHKLEPGRKLLDSRLIRSSARTWSKRSLLRLPPAAYSFGGDLLQMNDERTRPMTFTLVHPNTHLGARESNGSIDYREIAAIKADGHAAVLGFAPATRIDQGVLHYLMESWGSGRLARWLDVQEDQPEVYEEFEGLGRIQMFSPSGERAAYVGPSERVLRMTWLPVDRGESIHLPGRVPAFRLPEPLGAEEFLLEVEQWMG